MPYNFENQSFYSIDYNKLLATCLIESEKAFFKSKRIRKRYFNYWITKLKKADLETNKIRFPNKNQEYFQLTIPYDTQEITIVFSISDLLKQLPKSNKENTQFIPTELFKGQQAQLLWTPLTSFNRIMPLKNTPIIAVEYLYNYANFLVIDGNTRLTKWINDKKVIPTFCISAESLTNSNAFLNDFDKLHYLFRYDMAKIANLYSLNVFTDKQLIESSLLRPNALHLF